VTATAVEAAAGALVEARLDAVPFVRIAYSSCRTIRGTGKACESIAIVTAGACNIVAGV
jgi:hypothetical protein